MTYQSLLQDAKSDAVRACAIAQAFGSPLGVVTFVTIDCQGRQSLSTIPVKRYWRIQALIKKCESNASVLLSAQSQHGRRNENWIGFKFPYGERLRLEPIKPTLIAKRGELLFAMWRFSSPPRCENHLETITANLRDCIGLADEHPQIDLMPLPFTVWRNDKDQFENVELLDVKSNLDWSYDFKELDAKSRNRPLPLILDRERRAVK